MYKDFTDMDILPTPLRYISILALVFLASTGIKAQQQDWKTRTITLDCQNGSMQDALAQVASQAKISLLADGVPLSRPFTCKAQGTAEKILTQIAYAYDYDWSVSKSGIVLLTKRFADEQNLPEVNPEELRTSAHNALSILETFYTPSPEDAIGYYLFPRLQSLLTPEETQQLRAGTLVVSSLGPDARRQALKIIYQHEFGDIHRYLGWMEQMMTALPKARLISAKQYYSQYPKAEGIVLYFPNNEAVSSGLYLHSQPQNAAPPPSPAPASIASNVDVSLKPTALPANLHKVSTIQEAFDMLATRFHITATLSPKMYARHFMLLLHDADAPRVLPALAEMRRWRLQRQEGAEEHFYLYRPNVAAPSATMAEISKAIWQTFPADILKSLYTRPDTLEGKKFTDPFDRYPNLPGRDDPSLFVYSKLQAQFRMVNAHFQSSLANRAFEKPVSFAALTLDQQRDLTYLLFNNIVGQCADKLWKAINRPNSYVTDPLNARLFGEGNTYGVIGPTGGKFTQTRGHL